MVEGYYIMLFAFENNHILEVLQMGSSIVPILITVSNNEVIRLLKKKDENFMSIKFITNEIFLSYRRYRCNVDYT